MYSTVNTIPYQLEYDEVVPDNDDPTVLVRSGPCPVESVAAPPTTDFRPSSHVYKNGRSDTFSSGKVRDMSQQFCT